LIIEYCNFVMDIGIEKVQPRREWRIVSLFKMIFLIIFVLVLIFAAIVSTVQTKYNDKILEMNKLDGLNVGLVFGAGLRTPDSPSHILEDRILTAIKLYQEGKVGRFIMSGDNQDPTHSEVQVMKEFAISQGLPENAILMDYAGVNTYESCKHVKDLFGLNKVVLITQQYHLHRALYTCNELGLDAVGIPAISRNYVNQVKYSIREIFASVNAWLDMKFSKK